MFWTRLFSGGVLLAGAIGAIWYGGGLLAGVLLIASLIAYKELTTALKVNESLKSICLPEGLGLLGVVIYYLTVTFIGEAICLLMVIVLLFLAFMFVYVFAFPKYDISKIVSAFFAFMYAPVMLSFVYMTRETFKIYIVWLILISSWGSDTCAYAVGMLFGKHKIFPVLSPKKSLEGCIGGVLGAGLLGGIYGCFLLRAGEFSGVAGIGIIVFVCCVGAVMSMVGDLAASAIKRQNGIKDYGNLIPGHGGIMDRFDSVIVTAPLVYYLCFIIFLIAF